MKMIEKIKNLFFIKNGGKKIIHKNNSLILIFIIFSSWIILDYFFYRKNDAAIRHTTNRQKPRNQENAKTTKKPVNIGGIKDFIPVRKKPKKQKKKIFSPINYDGKLVFYNPHVKKSKVKAQRLIGKLLDAIDTRFPVKIRILLPLGEGSLARNTILIGKVTGTKEERIHIHFTRAHSSSEEKAISAIALDPKDYKPGIIGILHGNSLRRIGKTIGLTMLGAVSETLIEKEKIGASISPKANLKNGLLRGTAEISSLEARKYLKEEENTKPYLTVNAGKAIIIETK